MGDRLPHCRLFILLLWHRLTVKVLSVQRAANRIESDGTPEVVLLFTFSDARVMNCVHAFTAAGPGVVNHRGRRPRRGGLSPRDRRRDSLLAVDFSAPGPGCRRGSESGERECGERRAARANECSLLPPLVCNVAVNERRRRMKKEKKKKTHEE
ncbi:hypothetical protein EYF80_033759 [Liparis tanakae]|uniref:Secreted protein n=1 Tax=Liparis tanakae TaxID=230148 RepID=A0A4Z2GTC6_9TELE|nr:hypothetical protein EYF80_033759 [Liparis tanakae]